MGSMFADAKVIATGKKSKGKQEPTPEHKLAGLYDLAAIDALLKSLVAVKKTLDSEVKGSAETIFIAKALATGKRPENFDAVDSEDTDATANVQLKRRASNSALNETEVEQFVELGIPFDIVTDTVETFVINPDYATDMALLAKVEKALKSVKGLPQNFFMKQAAVKSAVVSDKTIDHICNDKALVQACLKTATTLAIKPHLEVEDMAALAQDILSRYLGVEEPNDAGMKRVVKA